MSIAQSASSSRLTRPRAARSRHDGQADGSRTRGRSRVHRDAAHSLSRTPVLRSSALHATNPCACISKDVVAYRDDGDWVCARCGRQAAPQASWPVHAPPEQLADPVPVA